MFKAARWKSDRNKTKAVFKIQLRATKVPQLGRKELVASLIPLDSGKPTARSEKALVVQGSCHWPIPIYEEAGLTQDPNTGKINEKPYRLVLSANGSGKSEFLGEIAIDLANYAESFKPSFVSLPLKPPNADTVVHITLQRVHGEAEGRGTDVNADNAAEKDQRRTLRSQLHNSESEDEKTLANTKQLITSPAAAKPSSRTVAAQVGSNRSLGMLDSFEAISSSVSSSSSGGYTPKENDNMDNVLYQGSGNLSSPPSNNCSPLSSGEVLPRDESRELDGQLEKLKDDIIALTRQLEVSELELQTLRKQVVKECRKGQHLSRDLQSMKEERDELGRECEELKTSKKSAEYEEHFLGMLLYPGKDLWSILEETKQELNYEKKTNANISLQLKKTQESNSELILAVRDLEELLQQNRGEICSCGSRRAYTVSEEETTNKMDLPCHSESKQDFVGTPDQEEDDEQYTHKLDVSVKENGPVELMGFPDQNVAQLTTELELYKKEREELEMQMEQLALDYEILKQENHFISTRLEQVQLREQLRMQYENSGYCPSIIDLETQIECMEKEHVKQEEAFQADLGVLIRDKVELEKRAIQAEEALRKTMLHNCNTAEQLQNEFKRLAVQMSSAFHMNEKMVMQKLKECNDLRLQKSQLEGMLQKKDEEVESLRSQHRLKCQQLVGLIDFKTKEVDKLHMELKEKCKELEEQRLSAEALQKASLEQIAHLKFEIESLSAKNDQLVEQIKHQEVLFEELKHLKVSTEGSEALTEEYTTQRSMLEEERSLLEEEASKFLLESTEPEQIIDNDAIVRNLNAEFVAQRVNYNALKHPMFEDELAKENPRQQFVLLVDDLPKETGIVTTIDHKLKGHSAKLPNNGPKKTSTRSKIFKKAQEQEQLSFKTTAPSHEKTTIFEVNLVGYQEVDMHGDTTSIMEPLGSVKPRAQECRNNDYTLQDSFLEDNTLVKTALSRS